MFDLWIMYAVMSGIFVSIREMYIKKFIHQSPEIISFTTRFFGSFIFLFLAFGSSIKITNIPVFIGITFLTVVITAFTTVVRLRMIKTEELSLTTPWLGMVPLFMIFWCILLYGQVPNAAAISGILAVCVGAFTINLKGKRLQINKASLWMLLIAVLLGLTTSVDKIAIGASSAVTYSLIWTITSAFLMYGVARKRSGKVFYFDRHLMIQAALWVAEFLFQMLAIQHVSRLSSGPTYVKTLTMLNIVITTVAGSLTFKEKDRGKRIISAILIFFGAAMVILFR